MRQPLLGNDTINGDSTMKQVMPLHVTTGITIAKGVFYLCTEPGLKQALYIYIVCIYSYICMINV
jgi:hypothetical protein